MEDWLIKALAADRRSWKEATETGRRLLSARLFEQKSEVGGNLAIYYRADDGNNYKISRPGKINKIKSMTAIKEDFKEYNPELAEEIENILYTADPTEQLVIQSVIHERQKTDKNVDK